MGFDAIDPNIGGIPGIGTSGVAGTDTPITTYDTGQSTVSQSEEDQPEYGGLFLPFPFQFITQHPEQAINSFLAALDKNEEKIINSILDGWSKNLQEVADQQKVDQKITEIRDNLKRVFQEARAIVTEAQQSDNPSNAGLAFGAMMMVFALVLAGPSSFAISQVQGSGDAIINGVAQFAVDAGIIQPQFLAAFGLIGVLFLIPILNASVGSTLGAAGGDPKEIKDLDYAKQFADQVAKFVTNAGYESFLTAAVLSKNPELAANPQELTKMVAMMKLAMLFSAMALLYRTETGGITKEEMQGLLDGTIDLPEGDRRLALAQFINEILQDFPPEMREVVKQGFLSYFDDNHSVDDLAEPLSILAFFGESPDYEMITETST